MEKGKFKVQFKRTDSLLSSDVNTKQEEDLTAKEDHLDNLNSKLKEMALSLSGIMDKSYDENFLFSGKIKAFPVKQIQHSSPPFLKVQTKKHLPDICYTGINHILWSNLNPTNFDDKNLIAFNPKAHDKQVNVEKSDACIEEEASQDDESLFLTPDEMMTRKVRPDRENIPEQEPEDSEEEEEEEASQDDESLFLTPDEMMTRKVRPDRENIPEQEPEDSEEEEEEEASQDDESLFLTPDEMMARKVRPDRENVPEEEAEDSEEEEEEASQDDESLFITPDEMIKRKFSDTSSKKEKAKPAHREELTSEDLILSRFMERIEEPARVGIEDERFRADPELVDEVSSQETIDTTTPSLLDTQESENTFSNSDSILAMAINEEYDRIQSFTSIAGKLSPDEMSGELLLDDNFKQLTDLGPITKKSSIDSPDELLSPDELEEEEEFVSNALPKGTIIRQRYKIVKVLSEKRDRTTYKVIDTKREDKIYVLKEYITSFEHKNEYRLRRDAFRDTVRILSTFRHPNLVNVYEAFTENYRDYYLMEVVDGLTIVKLAEMNTKPFSEKEVLKWGYQLCAATEFMHYRPTPFTLGDIKPCHIMVDLDGKIRITGYDLQRFFDPNRTLEFLPDDPKKLYDDVTKVARILFFLLTKTQFQENKLEIQWPSNTRPKMKKLMEKACREGQRTYGDIKEFLQDLKDTQIEDNVEVLRRRIIFPVHKLDFTWVKNAYKKVISQHPLLICLEIALLSFLLFVFTAKRLESVYNRPSAPIFYVSTSEGVSLFNAKDNKFIRRFPIENDVSFIYPLTIDYNLDKNKSPQKTRVLLIGSKNSSVFRVINSQNFETLTGFIVEKAPHSGVLSPDKSTLYVIHPSLDIISVINTKSLKVKNILPAGDNPISILYLENKPEKTGSKEVSATPPPVVDKKSEIQPDAVKDAEEKKESPGCSLVISNSGSREIILLDGKTGKIENQLIVEGTPGAMLFIRERGEIVFADVASNRLGFLDPVKFEVDTYLNLPGQNPVSLAFDNKTKILWIALKDSNGLAAFDIVNNKFIDFSDEGTAVTKGDSVKAGIGQEPHKLYLDSENRKLWILNGKSNNITIMDLETNKVIKRIDLEQNPQAICLEPER